MTSLPTAEFSSSWILYVAFWKRNVTWAALATSAPAASATLISMRPVELREGEPLSRASTCRWKSRPESIVKDVVAVSTPVLGWMRNFEFAGSLIKLYMISPLAPSSLSSAMIWSSCWLGCVKAGTSAINGYLTKTGLLSLTSVTLMWICAFSERAS